MGTRAYVTRSLEDALWAVEESTCLEDGALLAVNLGEDADTTGAVYGQLAGAYYGVDSIPERWRSTLAKLDVVESFVSASTKRRSRSREPSLAGLPLGLDRDPPESWKTWRTRSPLFDPDPRGARRRRTSCDSDSSRLRDRSMRLATNRQ